MIKTSNRTKMKDEKQRDPVATGIRASTGRLGTCITEVDLVLRIGSRKCQHLPVKMRQRLEMTLP
jgi:hypothetical protein